MTLPGNYTTVTSLADDKTVHAFAQGADATACGRLEALDVKRPKLPKGHTLILNCPLCKRAMKAERQRKGREGRIAMREKHRREVEAATAGYEKAPDLGPDMVYIQNDEIDMILVNTMRSRAESLRAEGKTDLAGHLEQAADQLYENVSEEVRAFCANLDNSEGYL